MDNRGSVLTLRPALMGETEVGQRGNLWKKYNWLTRKIKRKAKLDIGKWFSYQC